MAILLTTIAVYITSFLLIRRGHAPRVARVRCVYEGSLVPEAMECLSDVALCRWLRVARASGRAPLTLNTLQNQEIKRSIVARYTRVWCE